MRLDDLRTLKVDKERSFSVERTIYRAYRRLPNRGGLSPARMTVANEVFRNRASPTTYEEAPADGIICLTCLEETIRGRRTLLMRNANLDDMTIAEQEKARKTEARRKAKQVQTFRGTTVRLATQPTQLRSKYSPPKRATGSGKLC